MSKDTTKNALLPEMGMAKFMTTTKVKQAAPYGCRPFCIYICKEDVTRLSPQPRKL